MIDRALLPLLPFALVGRVAELRARRLVCTALVAGALALAGPAGAAPLVTLEHHVAGARLRVGPEELWVPKNLPGSLVVEVVAADGTRAPELAALTVGTHVEAVLRGPAFPAFRVLGLPNEPLLLPPIALTGEYQLDDVRLVRTATNEILIMGTPSSVPVHVFPDVLVSAVTSRPLSASELVARGIDLDAESFSAVEFQVMFQLESERVPVYFPVVTPRSRDALDYLPLAEREALLVEADLVNRRLAAEVALPRGLEVPGLGLQVTPINFQQVDPLDETEPSPEPMIPGLVVIPGNVGFLDRFFSVQVFTANAAPAGSGITVHGLEAELLLPPGRDRLPSTGDEPLILPRIDGAVAPARAPMTSPGSDGQLGTPDDQPRLFPGQTAQTELVVQAKREGLHTFDLLLTGTLDGLAAGEVTITGRTFGSVLVRNPRFSIVFGHPRTVRAGEPYTASITVLNTSDVPAELVSVHLPAASVSGVTLTSAEGVALGTIAPGESRTAEFAFTARLSGHVGMTNMTGDDGLTGGRFDFRLGVDERGVALSDATIGYPEWVDALPAPLRRAADRVLGQALGVATAAVLPAGVRGIARAHVDRRIVELAEAGQRVRYDDDAVRVFADLLLDWHGGRVPSRGFDQLLGETDAGRGFGLALLDALALDGLGGGRAWLLATAAELAGRGEAWGFVATEDPAIEPAITRAGLVTGFRHEGGASTRVRELTESGTYGGTGGWLVPFARPFEPSEPSLEVSFRVPAGQAASTVTWLVVDGAGQGTRFDYAATSEPTRDVCLVVDPTAPALAIRDVDCDASTDGSIVGISTEIHENQPQIVSIFQDLEVRVGRPEPFCGGPTFERLGRTTQYGNYGTILAVLFSKVMDQASLERLGAFSLDDGSPTNGVAIQPGGRVALVNLRMAVGDPAEGFAPHALVTSDVVDERGQPLVATTHPITASATQGIRIRGRVLSSGGDPVPNVPVTLTMHDDKARTPSCLPADRSPSQTRTAADGRFTFDFVMADKRYTLATIDDRGVPAGVLELITEASLNGVVDADRLALLAREPGRAADLVAALGTADLVTAIQQAQTIDRATFTDSVASWSPRRATEVPVALRFRGRGTITGTVLASDGLTPVAGAAVNLFPEASSRELGRGQLSDASGRFAFYGVPLGAVTVDVATSEGLRRTIAARLSTPGETQDLEVVLSEAPVPIGELAGVVYEADGVTPHAGARVVLLATNRELAGVAVADASGAYVVPDALAQPFDALAVSVDGRRVSPERRIVVPANGRAVASFVLQGTAELTGRVELANGDPAPFALVAGGASVVTADASGTFRLTGVPTGRRRIDAALPRDPARGLEVTRFGFTEVDVLPGAANVAVIRFGAVGRVVGRVVDVSGRAVPNVRVARPSGSGFEWVLADEQGEFVFDNLPLGPHLFSAPAPGVITTEAVDAAFASGGRDELVAAITDYVLALQSGPSAPDPTGYGFTRVSLDYDGQTVRADISPLASGTVSGRVESANGVPITADVDLFGTSIGRTGEPTIGLAASMRSDAVTGEFSFSMLEGPFSVSARSVFYPSAVQASGSVSRQSPNTSGILLQFPPASETRGGIRGVVLLDGAPVLRARVRVDWDASYEISTSDVDGTFDTERLLPAPRFYGIDVFDPTTGREAYARVHVLPGETTDVTVPLLASTGTLELQVRQASGAPAPGADVDLVRAGRPVRNYQTPADASGALVLTNVLEGEYSATACWTPGQSRLCATGRIVVSPGAHATATIVLGGAGTIAGRYVEADGVTPVGFAQISVGAVGFTSTSSTGNYALAGVPLGRHAVAGTNAVTGRGARGIAVLTHEGQTAIVDLREDALGEVVGRVLDQDGATPVPAASVQFTSRNTLFPSLSVTTDPTGRFQVPGVPEGPFSLSARTPWTPAVSGFVEGTMPATLGQLVQDVVLPAAADLEVTITDGNGAPARARVAISGGAGTVDTSTAGTATFARVPLGVVTVAAHGLDAGATWSTARTTVTLASRGAVAQVALALSGVVTVEGVVRDASGLPVAHAEVTLTADDPLVNTALRRTRQPGALTAGDGTFSFTDVPPGTLSLRAISGALAAEAEVTATVAASPVTVDLQLGASARVHGVAVRADGTSPFAFGEISIQYSAPSGLEGSHQTFTDATGAFELSGIPVDRGYSLHALLPSPQDGVLRVVGNIPANATDVDVGVVRFDEASPTVVAVTPASGADGVPVDTLVELELSEVMDPGSANAAGVYLAAGNTNVPATLAWDCAPAGCTRVRVVPAAPLASQTTYALVAIAGELRLLDGSESARGPRDLAGRPLALPFVSTFTTADAEPPVIDELTPDDGAEQLAIDTVVRVVTSEAVDPASVILTLTDALGAPVPGVTSVGLGDRVVVFVPSALLAPNSHYLATLAALSDRAGNSAEGLPRVHEFRTLDTIGPTLTDLTPVGVRALVRGITARFDATLAAPEPGVMIQASVRPPALVAASMPDDLGVSIALTTTGTLTLFTHGVDRFGNVGPWLDSTFTVAENQPPTVAITAPRLVTGTSYAIRIEADDDSAVTAVDVELSGLRTEAFTQAGGAPIVISGVIARSQGPATLSIRAEAEDNAGATSGPELRTLVVEDGVAPELTASTGGTQVSPGDLVTLHVAASDAFGLARLTVASGRIPSASIEELFTGAPTTFEGDYPFAIPTDAAPFERIVITADLTDVSGWSTSRSVELFVRDVIPPTVSYSVPADGAQDVSLFAPIEVVFSEPVTGASDASVRLLASGVVVPTTRGGGGDRLTITAGPLAPSTQYSLELGAAITDLSGNALAPTTLTFTTGNPDVIAPRLVSVTPEDEAAGVLPPDFIDYAFDEALVALTSTSVVTLATEADAVALPVDLFLTNGGRMIRARPRSALQLGTSYTLSLAPLPTDVAGNTIVGPDGQPFTAYETRFTTARLAVVSPGIARVVEGQRVDVTLDFEAQTAPINTDWLVNGVEVGAVTSLAPSWTVTVPSLAGATTGTVTIGARVFTTGRHTLDATPRTLVVEPALGDWDGDGMSNGAEAQAGTDPWRNDVSEDPDGDGLTNAQELALGTSPFDADSDHDGVNDFDDLNPLHGNRQPGTGFAGPARGVAFDGTAARFLDLPASASLRPPFTLELWVLPNGTGTLVEGTAPNTLRIALPTATSFELGLATAAEGWQTHVATVASTTGQWHHVAVTYDGQTLRGYFDGNLAIQHARSGELENPPGNSLRVGANFLGTIDEIRTFGIARTASALQSTMHRVLDATEPGLTGRWALDETSGTTAADATGLWGAATLSTASAWAASGAPVFETTSARALSGVETTLDTMTFLTFDLDTRTAPAVRIATLPAHGALYARSEPGATELGARITTVPYVPTQRYVVYVADAGWSGGDTFSIDTTDGTTTSLPAVIELAPGTARTFVGLDATAPSAWSSANNWDPQGVPTSGESVVIPAGLPAPVVLAADADIASLTLAAGAVLELQGPRTLTVAGHATNDGTIQGTGTVVLAGPTGVLTGNYPGLRVTRDLELGGPVEVAGNLLVVGRRLALGAHTLHVAGNLEAFRAPELDHPLAVLDVDGDATFGCPDYLGLSSSMILSQGTVRVGGDFTARACGYVPPWSPSFPATGTLTVVLDGAGPQNVSLANAAPGIANFQNLTVATPGPAGAVLTDRTSVLGALTVQPGGLVRGAGPLVVLGTATVEGGGAVDVEGLEPRGTWSVAPGGTAHTELLRATSEAELGFTTVAYDRLAVGANITLTAPLAIAGDLELARGTLSLSGHSASISGDLIVTAGALAMAQPQEVLVVGGGVRVEPVDATPSTLTAGTLRIGGDFLLGTGGLTFAPTGTHRTVFDGLAPVTIDVSQALTFFQHLELRAASVSIVAPGGFSGLEAWDLVVASPLVVGAGTNVNVSNALIVEPPGGTISNAGTLSAWYCSPYPLPIVGNAAFCGGPLP